MRPGIIAFYTSSAVLWAFAAVGLYHVIERHLAIPASNPLFLTAYFAALIALAGWMVQAGISMRNSKKQHTINLLMQYRMNPQFNENVANIQTYYKSGTPIHYDEIENHADQSIKESVRFILNYYEFIAAAVRHGDLDMALLRDCLCSQFCGFCERCEDVIKNVRKEDNMGRPAPDRVRLLQNLRWLQRKWTTFSKKKNQRLPLKGRVADFFLKY